MIFRKQKRGSHDGLRVFFSSLRMAAELHPMTDQTQRR